MAVPLKDCAQCSYFRGNHCYGFGTAKRVLTTAEALLCGKYTPLVHTEIGPLSALAGQLVEYQIPSEIISTIKLADLAVTNAKLSPNAVTADKIADGTIGTLELDDLSVTSTKLAAEAVLNSKVAPAAGIVESKLNLDYGTDSLNDAIILRELLANKDVANGYLGLDANAKVPLSKLNPLTNSEIDAEAAILESKLSLDQSTADLLLAATYLAHDHSPADPTQVNHANLLNVLTDQHHAQVHTLGSHSTKAHSELTDVLTSQHHVRYADSEAKAACISDAVYGSGWNGVTDVAPSKNAVYDKVESVIKSLNWPHAQMWHVTNGAIIAGQYGLTVKLLANDNDCAVTTTLHLGPDWASVQSYLRILYQVSSNNPYSVQWSVSAQKSGESGNWNKFNGSTLWDFPAAPANQLATHSLDMGTDLEGGDRIGIYIRSDALNTPDLLIHAIWVQYQ